MWISYTSLSTNLQLHIGCYTIYSNCEHLLIYIIQTYKTYLALLVPTEHIMGYNHHHQIRFQVSQNRQTTNTNVLRRTSSRLETKCQVEEHTQS